MAHQPNNKAKKERDLANTDEDLQKIFGDPDAHDFDLLEAFDNDGLDVAVMPESRYTKPVKHPHHKITNIGFARAQDLVQRINLQRGEGIFCFVDGSFVFADFLFAFMIRHGIVAEELTISTLSLGEANMDKLRQLIDAGHIKKINLILSIYFWAHEGKKKMRYLYQKLDIGDRLQVAVCRSHSKMTLIETNRGAKIVMHGSANLRSSDNIEQFRLEFDDGMYDFAYNYQMALVKTFKTIQKPLTTKQAKAAMAHAQDKQNQ